MTAEQTTVSEALAAVMRDVQGIAKGDKNTQQNFSYRGIDSVLNAVGPALRTHGVVCVPIDAQYDDEHYETKKGAQMRSVTVRIRWRFYGPGGDYIDTMTLGEAADAGDKAVPKASSVAYRTLLLQALCIPVGDEDPDATSHERGSAPVQRQDGPPAVPVPNTWPKIEKAIRQADNPEEAWELFKAFLRAASYHLYGQTDQDAISKQERLVLLQKAAGAAVWLADNVKPEGADFIFYDEEAQRKAWAHVLDGVALEIPDYIPPEPPGAAAEELEQQAAEADEA